MKRSTFKRLVKRRSKKRKSVKNKGGFNIKKFLIAIYSTCAVGMCQPDKPYPLPSVWKKCPKLCDTLSNVPIDYNVLRQQPTRLRADMPVIPQLHVSDEPEENRYIFVIPVSDPSTLIYYPTTTRGVSCDTGESFHLHHNCLAENDSVLSAGEMWPSEDGTTININPLSGHYQPSFTSLHIPSAILESNGFNVARRMFDDTIIP